MTAVAEKQQQQQELQQPAATGWSGTGCTLGCKTIEECLTFWPPALHSEVKKYGCSNTFDAGLETLGYPPQWTQTGREAKAVKDRLKRPQISPPSP